MRKMTLSLANEREVRIAQSILADFCSQVRGNVGVTNYKVDHFLDTDKKAVAEKRSFSPRRSLKLSYYSANGKWTLEISEAPSPPIVIRPSNSTLQLRIFKRVMFVHFDVTTSDPNRVARRIIVIKHKKEKVNE